MCVWVWMIVSDWLFVTLRWTCGLSSVFLCPISSCMNQERRKQVKGNDVSRPESSLKVITRAYQVRCLALDPSSRFRISLNYLLQQNTFISWKWIISLYLVLSFIFSPLFIFMFLKVKLNLQVLICFQRKCLWSMLLWGPCQTGSLFFIVIFQKIKEEVIYLGFILCVKTHRNV